MKRFFAVIIAFLMLFSFFACGENVETTEAIDSVSSDGAMTSETKDSSDGSTEDVVTVITEEESEAIDSEAVISTEKHSETESVILVDTDAVTETEEAKETGAETDVETDADTETETDAETDANIDADTDEDTNSENETESPYLAPDFTVYDAEGNEVKLSDFRGKPIVLNFWASGCGPCVAEMPEFQKAYEEYGDRVVFLMVNYIGFFGETVQSASNFVENNGYTFPVYFDSEHDAAATYGINSIPQTFFITKEFDLYSYVTGSTSYSVLQQYIEIILVFELN